MSKSSKHILQPNREPSAGGSSKPPVIGSVRWYIYDTWGEKIVCDGSYEKCEKFLDSKNEYGYNYSRLRIRKHENIKI